MNDTVGDNGARAGEAVGIDAVGNIALGDDGARVEQLLSGTMEPGLGRLSRSMQSAVGNVAVGDD